MNGMKRRIGESVKRSNSRSRLFSVSPFHRLPVSRRFAAGQAMTELVFILPFILVLAGGAISVAYICFQGLKVQQAANLAARIQGQERVAGGKVVASILQDNGVGDGTGDDAASAAKALQELQSNPHALDGRTVTLPTGVYGHYYKAVQSLFSKGEQEKLFVLPPHSGINTDAVEVIRILAPPKILNYQMPPVELTATAYGGEDTHAFGLPRWGSVPNTTSASGLFWQDRNILQKGKDDQP